jgi:hypothetical protein
MSTSTSSTDPTDSVALSQFLALIGKQQIELEKLKQAVGDQRATLDAIHKKLICVGGPLNGNALEFTCKQLNLFYKIKRIIEGVLNEH